MEHAELRAKVEAAFADRSQLSDAAVKQAVLDTVQLLDTGKLRVATCDAPGEWTTHAWVKQAILLYFGVAAMETMERRPLRVPRQDPAQAGPRRRPACASCRPAPCATARSSSPARS